MRNVKFFLPNLIYSYRFRHSAVVSLVFTLLFSMVSPALSFKRILSVAEGKKLSADKNLYKRQSKNSDKKQKERLISTQNGTRKLERMDIPAAAQLTVEQIMAQQNARAGYKTARERNFESGLLLRKNRFSRKMLREVPALPGIQFPASAEKEIENLPSAAPQTSAQTLGITFDGATGPTETDAFPPDMQIGVGPTQIVVFVNGRLRTFNKTTGVADGVLNIAPDSFFSSVITPAGAGESVSTIYPRVRYDRLSNRWFLNIIDSTIDTSTGEFSNPNRILLAVSDAAGNGTITPATVWTFYQFQADATGYADYQSFGVDANALYIGANIYTLAGDFDNTKAWIIPKSPALSGSSLTVWTADNLLIGGAGPFAPQGVDNPDPNNTGPAAVGYFIGIDNATFNTLVIRRITNPGSLGSAPTVSENISVTVNETQFPVQVPHLGNTGGADGRLDALDDRLSAASIRNGRLWTAHNIGVNNTGTTESPRTRNAARWYELQNLNTTPTIVQSGTLFDNTGPNDENQRSYWIPSIAVSGQGHAVLASSIAGANERVNAFATGRLAGDTLGTMREGPGGAELPGFTNSTFAYNPADDAGGSLGRRWGDYSMTVVDPLDDITMWTIQQYVNGTDTYGVRVAQLIAPPPATPTAATPIDIPAGQTSVNVNITGAIVNGSGFYDPGQNLGAPALPFNHITASVSGTNVIVNSVTYNSPTSITLNLNTTGAVAGLRNLTVTNPDGQSRTGNNILNVTTSGNSVSGIVSYGTTPANQSVKFVPGVTLTGAGTPQVSAATNSSGNYQLSGFGSGSYVVTPSKTGDVNGISSFDASLAARKSANLISLTANQLIAADVSDNGSVSSFDASLIARTAAGIANTGIAGQWKFVPKSKEYQTVTSNLTTENYEAVLMGEVSGNWTAPMTASLEEKLTDLEQKEADRTEEQVYLQTQRLFALNQTADILSKNSSQWSFGNLTSPELAGIQVTLPPDATGSAGTTISVPVTVGDTTGQDIFGFDFTVSFDPDVLELASPAFDTTGTLAGAAGFTITPNTSTPGKITISGFGTQPLTGSGVLIYLRFTVKSSSKFMTDLTFDSFIFNEGEPSAKTTDGRFTRPTAAQVSVSGRVVTRKGTPLSRATVIMTDTEGNTRTAVTNSFGYYRFESVSVGQTYVFEVRAKGRNFSSQAVTVNAVMENINFVPVP